MKLTPRQTKVFHAIMKLKYKFNEEKSDLLGNALIQKCDYLVRLMYDENKLATVFDKQKEYDIVEFTNSVKNYVMEVLKHEQK